MIFWQKFPDENRKLGALVREKIRQAKVVVIFYKFSESAAAAIAGASRLRRRTMHLVVLGPSMFK